MSEIRKTERRFILFVVWVLFITLTLSGIVYAGERTAYISNGKEPETVKFEIYNMKK